MASRPTCAQCSNVWQWGGLCPECITAEDKAAARAMKAPRSALVSTKHQARGLRAHERVDATPRRQPTVN